MIHVEQWAPADGLSLEPNALAAATGIDRNLALTAGPGAGKTEMLAQRADFLLRTGIIRSSIDLPQPDGPTRTQNSPSAMAMSTPRMTCVEPKYFWTALMVTAAIYRP